MPSVKEPVKKVAYFFQGRVINAAKSVLAFATQPDQACFVEYLELLRDGRLADAETLLKLLDTMDIGRNQVQDPKTRFLTESTKCPDRIFRPWYRLHLPCGDQLSALY